MQVDPDRLDDDSQARDAFRPEVRTRRQARRLGLSHSSRDADVLAVVALGGAVGSLARYGTARLLPTGAHGFPWATFLVNMVGCLLIGVLMVFVTDVWRPGRYARPFLGIGVLGGLTTYSTMMVELRALGAGGDWLVAEVYLVGSLLGGLVAVWLGLAGTRLLTRPSVRSKRRAGTERSGGR